MNKLKKQLKNLKAALILWDEVNPENIIPGLKYFQSDDGTKNCFGGHLTKWNYFRKQGLSLKDGVPKMVSAGGNYQIPGDQIVNELFGPPFDTTCRSRNLFSTRSKTDPESLASDKDYVTNMLQEQIKHIKSLIKLEKEAV